MLLEDVSLGFLQSHLLDRSFFDAAVKNTRNKNGHRSSLPAAHKDVNKPECSSMRNKRKLLAHAITYNGAMPTCCFPTRCDTKQKSELAKNAKYLMRPCLLPCSQNQLRSLFFGPPDRPRNWPCLSKRRFGPPDRPRKWSCLLKRRFGPPDRPRSWPCLLTIGSPILRLPRFPARKHKTRGCLFSCPHGSPNPRGSIGGPGSLLRRDRVAHRAWTLGPRRTGALVPGTPVFGSRGPRAPGARGPKTFGAPETPEARGSRSHWVPRHLQTSPTRKMVRPGRGGLRHVHPSRD